MKGSISTTILYFCSIVIFHCQYACLSKKGPDILSTDRAIRLLALDTGKLWVRTAIKVDGEQIDLLDCELQNRYSFNFIEDADTAFYIGANSDCTQLSADTLNRWSWKVLGNIKEEFLDSLELKDGAGEILTRRITDLTSDNLSWEFIEEASEIWESFKWQKEPLD